MKKSLVLALAFMLVSAITLIFKPVKVFASNSEDLNNGKVFLEAKEAGFGIVWNDEEFKPEMPVVLIDGRVYIPLREFANRAGFIVDWNGKNESITIKRFKYFMTQEGFLLNGIKYTFFGVDKYDYSYDKTFTESDFVRLDDSKESGKFAEIPQEAALIALRSYFRDRNPEPVDEWKVDVYFDYKKYCWVIEIGTIYIPFSITEETIDGETIWAMNGSTIVKYGDIVFTIDYNDGTLEEYSTFFLGSIYRPELTTIFSASETVDLDADIVGNRIIWNRKKYASELPVVMINNRIYIPLREFAYQAELTVDLNEEEKTITVLRE